MEQYSFDRLGQLMPCPDREKCGAYLLSPLPDGTPRGCTGERKWCKQKFNHTERGETCKKIKLSKQQVNNILEIIETIIKGSEVSDER